MDQQKIGAFLKELRKEKNITQEQLADEMRVSLSNSYIFSITYGADI